MELKGSRTEANLLAAFAGESQARNKYSFYAAKWFKLLRAIGTTQENLKKAAEGENFEWTDMYAQFEKEAREEGFDYIADLFKGVAEIEQQHEIRYRSYLDEVENNKVFSSDTEIEWICMNCGHIHKGTNPPEVCPVCAHQKSYFKKK